MKLCLWIMCHFPGLGPCLPLVDLRTLSLSSGTWHRHFCLYVFSSKCWGSCPLHLSRFWGPWQTYLVPNTCVPGFPSTARPRFCATELHLQVGKSKCLCALPTGLANCCYVTEFLILTSFPLQQTKIATFPTCPLLIRSYPIDRKRYNGNLG